jgi:hypothetical protein
MTRFSYLALALLATFLLFLQSQAEACHRHRATQACFAMSAPPHLVDNGNSTDKCGQSEIQVYSLGTWYRIPRNGLTYRVPVDPNLTTLIWHCEGPQNETSNMPRGSAFLDLRLPPSERVIYEQYWRWAN